MSAGESAVEPAQHPTGTPHPEFAWSDLGFGGRLRLPVESSGFRYTWDGRSALYRIFAALRARGSGVVLVPGLHCPTLIEPILQAGFSVRYYDVSLDLGRACDLRAEPEVVRGVVAVNYFGFEFDLESIKAVVAPETCVVEDCSHSCISADTGAMTGQRADAACYSFWKQIPTRIGGAARTGTSGPALAPSTATAPWRARARPWKAIVTESLHACSGRALGSGRGTHAGRRDAASLAVPDGPIVRPPWQQMYPFSVAAAGWGLPSSLRRLIGWADWLRIAAARRRNYRVAVEALRGIDGVEVLMPELTPRVSPWAVPVLLEDRQSTDYRLRNAGVPLFTFGETAHPTFVADTAACPNSIRLARDLICLPVHQRLDAEQIQGYCTRLAQVLRSRARANARS